MIVLPAGPAPRPDRAASQVLFDHAHARVVAFHLEAGQQIPAHSTDSSVLIHVIEGEGVFRGNASEAKLSAGQIAVFAPGETHAILAGAEALRFVAILTPRPGG